MSVHLHEILHTGTWCAFYMDDNTVTTSDHLKT